MPRESAFTHQQWLAGLLPEIYSARAVLATADRLLRSEGPIERDIDGILAMYSIGVERLSKLLLGVAAVDAGRAWPDMRYTSRGWGHALAEMDRRLRETLAALVEAGEFEYARLLRGWLCTLDRDPIWNAVIAALEAYADKGRYHHLDQLSEGPASLSPKAMWDAVEAAALAYRPALAAHHLRTQSGASFDEFETALRAEIADSIKRWAGIVSLFGMHGVLGDDGRRIGADALADGALPIVTEPECLDA